MMKEIPTAEEWINQQFSKQFIDEEYGLKKEMNLMKKT